MFEELSDREYSFKLIRREKTGAKSNVYTRHKGIMRAPSSFDVECRLKKQYESETKYVIDQLCIRIGDSAGIVAVDWSLDDKVTSNYPDIPFRSAPTEEYISFADFLTLRQSHYQNAWKSFFPVMRNIEEQLS